MLRKGKWQKIRDDENYRIYERHIIKDKGVFNPPTRYVLQKTLDKSTKKRSTWLGYYDNLGQQHGLSSSPAKHYKVFNKFWK